MSKSLDLPAIIERPVASERRFIDCLKQLVSNSTRSQSKRKFDRSVRTISGKLSSAGSYE